VIDEYQAQDNLGEIADSLGEVDLPGRIAVLFVSDSADDVKDGCDEVRAGNIYDHDGSGLVDQHRCKGTQVKQDEPDQKEPFAADHVLRMSYVVNQVFDAVKREHTGDSDRDQLKGNLRHQHEDK